jgi:hypothetical protein
MANPTPVLPDVGSMMVPQLARGFRGLDHLDRDAVLGAAARVEVLDLGCDDSGPFGHNGVQSN